MLNVVIITLGFAVDENDHVSVPFLQLHCKELLKQNIKLTIISTQFPAKENFKWHGIDVVTITKKESQLKTKLLFNRRLNAALESIHKTKAIDAIHHIWFSKEVYTTQQFAEKRQIKYITTFAGQDVLPENETLQKINTYKGELVCVSKFQQLKLNETTNLKSFIIHWGIEDIGITKASRSIDLISCGWLNEIKNHSLFVDIVYELHKQKEIQKAVICGDGSELQPLLRKIAALGLKDIIECKGSLPRHEVLELMKASKILLHTSRFEGFGLVLAEGLACGCAVVSSPVGIAFEDNTITKCTTRDEFVKKIRQILKLTDEINIHNQYPITDTAASYIALYQK